MMYDEVKFFQVKGTWRAIDHATGCVYTRANPGEWIANHDEAPSERRWDAMKLSNPEWERMLAEFLNIAGEVLSE